MIKFPLISIIIPVYNTEKYLDQCINSVLSQKYRQIEVVLVDDGSTDMSPQKCDCYTKIDRRISVIHKTNGGLSDARNAGFSKSSGEYIIFLDSDDYWRDTEVLNKLIEKIHYTEFDFVLFNASYYFQNSTKITNFPAYNLKKGLSKNEKIKSLIERGIFPMSACFKLIKKDILINNEISFIKDQIAEDIPWFIRLLEVCNDFVTYDEPIYIYRQEVENSLTSTVSSKKINSLLNIVQTESEIYKRKNDDFSYSILSFLSYELSILLALNQFLSLQEKKTNNVEIKKLTWLFSYTRHSKAKKVIYLYRIVGYHFTALIVHFYIKHKRCFL